MTRVSSLGYSVNYDSLGRVKFDGLCVTRALGDYEYDFIIPIPDICETFTVTAPGYLLGGTDGAFGFGSRFLPNIVDIIKNSRSKGTRDIATEIAETTSEFTGDNSSVYFGRFE